MQNIEKIISRLREKLKGLFEGEKTGHSIDHLERTLNYALKLNEREGGDKIVIAVAAYVHDVHRIIGAREKRFCPPQESLPMVGEIISDIDLSEKQREHILYAVAHHEEYAFASGGVTVKDIESKIVQDADNLDAIGAIAIIRSFKYGAANGMPEYDPSIPFYYSDYNENNNDKTTIHHLYNKSTRLGEYLNTPSAREIAKEKTKLIKDFINLYVKEYNCDF